MPGIEINLDGESINKAVADAIMQSTIGKSIMDSIQRLKDKATSEYEWSQWVRKAVEQESKVLIGEMVRVHLGAAIKERVLQVIAKEVTDDFIAKMWTDAVANRNRY